MYPPSITTRITAYIYHKDPADGTFTCERAVLDGVFWNADSIAITKKTGIQVVNSGYISIPASAKATGRQWVFPEQWYALPADELAGYWTLDLKCLQYTRLVRGECPYAFSGGDAATFSKEIGAFAMAYPHAKIPTDVNPQIHGSPFLHHVEVKV